MADVFISYSQSERARIGPIVDALASLGLTVWSDARIRVGTGFQQEINRELLAAKAVIVCWSEASIKSRYVLAEAGKAWKLQKLVPCMLDECEPPTPFDMDQSVALNDWSGQPDHEGWQVMLDRIGELTGRAGLRELACLNVAGDENALAQWACRHRDDPSAKPILTRMEENERQIVANEVAAVRERHVSAQRKSQTELNALLNKHEKAFATWLTEAPAAGFSGRPPLAYMPEAERRQKAEADLAESEAREQAVASDLESARAELTHATAEADRLRVELDVSAKKIDDREQARRAADALAGERQSEVERLTVIVDGMRRSASPRWVAAACLVLGLVGGALAIQFGGFGSAGASAPELARANQRAAEANKLLTEATGERDSARDMLAAVLKALPGGAEQIGGINVTDTVRRIETERANRDQATRKLHNDLAAADIERKEAQAEAARLRADALATANRLAAMEAAARTQASEAQALAAQQATLQAAVASRDSTNRQLDAAQQQAAKDRDQARQEAAQQREAARLANVRIADLESSAKAQTTDGAARLAAQTAALQQAANARDEAKRQADAAAKELQASKSDFETRSTALSISLGQTRTALDAARADRDRLGDANKGLQDQVASLSKELAERRKTPPATDKPPPPPITGEADRECTSKAGSRFDPDNKVNLSNVSMSNLSLDALNSLIQTCKTALEEAQADARRKRAGPEHWRRLQAQLGRVYVQKAITQATRAGGVANEASKAAMKDGIANLANAAKHKNSFAMVWLADYHDGVFSRSVADSSGKAMLNDSLFDTPQPATARGYFDQAVEEGNVFAMTKLAQFLLRAPRPSASDVAKAEELLAKADRANEPRALIVRAIALINAKLEQDRPKSAREAKAAELIVRAGCRGDREAAERTKEDFPRLEYKPVSGC